MISAPPEYFAKFENMQISASKTPFPYIYQNQHRFQGPLNLFGEIHENNSNFYDCR